MNWKDKKVLVTGAGGFIGSHLAERLTELGARTRAFVHYNALGSHGWLAHSALAGEMEIYAGDITDRDSVRGAIEDVETVFHLAALIPIPYSYRAVTSYVQTNIVGTLNVLQACRDAGDRRLVHTSTSETYGTALYAPIDEKHPLQAQSPYAASKIGADKLVESFHRSFDQNVITVRPFNTFGPRQSLRAVIPSVILQALDGKTIRLGNLDPTRDFNFVGNTVEGFLAAAAHDSVRGVVVNLGSGTEISVGDTARLILAKVGTSAAFESEERRLRPDNSEVERLLCDNRLAAELIGWTPSVDLSEGLDRTIEWFRENRALYPQDSFRF